MKTAERLYSLYKAMYHALGSSAWWPGESPFEVAIGAILTQNTNWNNVEKAIANLKRAKALHPEMIAKMDISTLQELIRPSGFFRIKAQKLKNFVSFLAQEANMDILELKKQDTMSLRAKLLAVNGIGPETADSILNYALNLPVFVVDAYTKRMMIRHGLIHEECRYDELQALFMDNLQENTQFYNEFHALIVRTCKNWCKKQEANCANCPLHFDLEQ